MDNTLLEIKSSAELLRLLAESEESAARECNKLMVDLEFRRSLPINNQPLSIYDEQIV